MSKLQEVFDRIQESKHECKKINSSYKDALSNSQKYQNVIEESRKIKELKKQIEDAIKQDFSREFSRLDNLKAGISNDGELLSDIALNYVVKGQVIELTDKNNTEYEPIFSVKFKKVK